MYIHRVERTTASGVPERVTAAAAFGGELRRLSVHLFGIYSDKCRLKTGSTVAGVKEVVVFFDRHMGKWL